MTARLIVADDHPIVREGLRGLVARHEGLEVVAEAADGATAEALARSVPAELLVLDVAMPQRNGIQALEALRRDGIGLPVLFYTMVPVPQYAAYLRRAGAQGIVGKDEDETSLVRAIRTVLAGDTAFPPGLMARRTRNAQGGLAAGLSAREGQVLQGLLEGRPLVAIAAELGIGVPSVSTYRRRVLDKFGVTNNAELIRVMRP